MRINIYSQEITDEVQTEEKVSNTGITYSAVRIVLHSSPMLHHPPADDDRSGVTFWLPRSPERREALAATFEAMANAVRNAKPETGLDDDPSQAKPRTWGASLDSAMSDGPSLRRPPFNIAAVDEARALATKAERLHREADDEQDSDRRASLRRVACRLDLQADRLVPVEYRG